MKKSPSQRNGRFGSFAGVFAPNILTILGIILFLRTGWVVGQAGLAGALIIIGIANLPVGFSIGKPRNGPGLIGRAGAQGGNV